jgi:hypothetical protein
MAIGMSSRYVTISTSPAITATKKTNRRNTRYPSNRTTVGRDDPVFLASISRGLAPFRRVLRGFKSHFAYPVTSFTSWLSPALASCQCRAPPSTQP